MSVGNNSWLKYRFSQRALLVLKMSIGVILIWFLWTRISDAIYTSNLLDLSIASYGLTWFLVAITLSLVNWLLESRKWQLLVNPFQELTILTAFKSVLAGLATGLITPNRLGNFIGRLAYIAPEHRVQATVNTQVGNLAQFIVTIILGLFGLSVIAELFIPINFIWIPLIMLMLASWLYFQPKIILKTPLGTKLYSKWSKEVDDLANLPHTLKWRVLFFSLLRYFIFIVQFICLFKVFGIDTDPILIAMLSATTFLITTVIPGLFIGKLLVRESAAVLVFSWIGLPIQTILAVSFLLWLINLAIPSAFGWLFWLKRSDK